MEKRKILVVYVVVLCGAMTVLWGGFSQEPIEPSRPEAVSREARKYLVAHPAVENQDSEVDAILEEMARRPADDAREVQDVDNVEPKESEVERWKHFIRQHNDVSLILARNTGDVSVTQFLRDTRLNPTDHVIPSKDWQSLEVEVQRLNDVVKEFFAKETQIAPREMGALAKAGHGHTRKVVPTAKGDLLPGASLQVGGKEAYAARVVNGKAVVFLAEDLKETYKLIRAREYCASEIGFRIVNFFETHAGLGAQEGRAIIERMSAEMRSR